jgi:two-component system phosphate regulon sensor histidine kinase PhoR
MIELLLRPKSRGYQTVFANRSTKEAAMVEMSRIWKLYVTYTIILVAGMTLAGFVLEAQLKKKLKAHLIQDVLTLAQVVGKAVPENDDPTVLKNFSKTYHDIADVRVTLISAEGKVLADSDEKEAIGESRLDRPEVQDALRQKAGFATRYSDTLKMNMLYGAVFIREKGKIVRLAMPMSRVKVFQNEVMLLFSLALFLAPVMAMIISFFVAKYKIYQGDRYATGAWPRHL